MATVVTPHSFSQSALACRSQEVAPNRRTCAGKPPGVLPVGAAATRSTGTHTMCLSEWPSMPAALALRTVRGGGAARGGRDGLGAGLAWAGGGLRWLMRSSTLGEWGEAPAWDKRGAGGMPFPQRDRRIDTYRYASPMTGSPPLGPGCMTGTRRQCGVGHGPT